MYSTSTQKKFWTFSNEADLIKFRNEANRLFIENHKAEMSEAECEETFLTAVEEQLLFHQYELKLRMFCRNFRPELPRVVYATSCHYFKRFYLKSSLMEFHPKEILVTCVYLACKAEEFNVSVMQFVSNTFGDRNRASKIILESELLVLQQLQFQVTVHNPFRAVEGLLIGIKTHTQLKNPEGLRPHIDEFIDWMFLTDACLLYTPSQIALAAVLHAVSMVHENLDKYVTETLIGSSGVDKLCVIIKVIRKIRTMVKSPQPLTRSTQKMLESKLEKCEKLKQSSPPETSSVVSTDQSRVGEEEQEVSFAVQIESE